MADIQHYSKQSVNADDVRAVIDALCGEFITTGNLVEKFEKNLADYVKCNHAVVVNSCTSALYLALKALYIGPGDHVIVPSISFMATANAVEHCGAKVIFADVTDNILIDPKDVEQKLTGYVKAIIAVDYAGQVCDYAALKKFGVPVIADAAHSLGAVQNGIKVGAIADITCTSFHPVKTITTCEGGALLTNDAKIAASARRLRNHGVFKVTTSAKGTITAASNNKRKVANFEYDVVNIGWNFRLSDVQCALGISQLKRIDEIVAKRNYLHSVYSEAIRNYRNYLTVVNSNTAVAHDKNSDHLFVVRLPYDVSRKAIYVAMKEAGIGVQVHYKPIYRFTYYLNKYSGKFGAVHRTRLHKIFNCPNTEKVADQLLSLPLHCNMDIEDVYRVLNTLDEVVAKLQSANAISA